MERIITPDQLLTPEVSADPYPAYRQLRDRSPVNFLFMAAGARQGVEEPIRAWAFLKYDDVYAALRDHETFSSTRFPALRTAFPSLVLLEEDPPRHARLRRLVNKAFTVRRIETLTAWISGIADELIDRLDSSETEFVRHYTIPLPVKVISRLLGIPGDQYETFKRWTDALLTLVPSDQIENARSVGDMMAYFGKMIAARRAQGAEDLLTALVEADMEGEKLEEWESWVSRYCC